MKVLPILLVFALLIVQGEMWNNIFCSMMCNSWGCSGQLPTQCQSKCNTNWGGSGNTCKPSASLNWYLENTSPDLGGNLTVTNATGPSTSVCGSFNMYRTVDSSTTITITHSGVMIPFFQMIAYVGIISMDASGWKSSYWTSTTIYTLDFTDGAISVPNTMKLSSKSSNKNYCFAGVSEYWNRMSATYTYNTTATPLTWTLSNDNSPNTSALWGIKEFILITRRCNVICETCFGTATTQCWTCIANATVTYWLSNTTCSTVCQNHFGYTDNTGICVYCDLRCSACYNTLANCSACTTSGTWTSYLDSSDPTNITCINPCFPQYFANKATQTCDRCNLNCTTCINSANYCLQCIADFAWTGWSCYSPCPVHYFLQTNLTNCTACSAFCDVCLGPSTLCTVCTMTGVYKAYLHNTTNTSGSCVRLCTAGYYPQSFGGVGPNLCLKCNDSCSLCTGNPSPCQQCASTYFLYGSTCVSPCPNDTFESNLTGFGLCLDCNVVCVALTINMYFPSVVNTKMYVDMLFSQSLDFTTFNYQTFQNITIESKNIVYTLDMFNVTYKILNSNSYRIILEPVSYIFLYNATFIVTTESQPAIIDLSTSFMPFKPVNYQMTASLNWFLIHGPPFSSLQTAIMTSLSTLSSKTNDFLDKPYVQEIKKTGIFAMLFSGAQITSSSMLSNQIQSQNMYEGVRFFAIFAFFDAPPYEKISNQTKNFVTPSVESKIRHAQEVTGRQLFSTDTMYWRFQRTGQTSFFIYDVYMPMFLIIGCWILMIVAHLCKDKSWYPAHAGKLFSAVHKVHEVSLMYITMAAIVQFIYFQPSSSDRWISAIVCIVFNLYFICYELYIYYDMIRYPQAEIGNKKYDYYVLRYGCFLKNIRFEQYDINEEWSPKHWLRPYNFHILSYYKKFVMMVSLPLFYNTEYAQMSILFTIQFMEIVRVWNVWPFQSKRRNWLRFSLEFALLFFFLVNLIQITLLKEIMTSSASALGSVIVIFYGLGWAGVAACFYFNFAYIITGIYDFCVGIKVSNRAKMDYARKSYYYNKIKDYEKDNEASSRVLVNRWVKMGNLNNRSYGELPEINIRIEQYNIRSVSGKYEVEVRKITELKMKAEKNYRKSNNTTAGGKIERKMLVSQASNNRLYEIIDELYEQFQSPHVERVVLKTFLNVNQKEYSVGEDILFDVHKMFQRVELISYDNEKSEQALPQLLERFPLDEQLFSNLS